MAALLLVFLCKAQEGPLTHTTTEELTEGKKEIKGKVMTTPKVEEVYFGYVGEHRVRDK